MLIHKIEIQSIKFKKYNHMLGLILIIMESHCKYMENQHKPC